MLLSPRTVGRNPTGQHVLSKPRCHGVGCCDAASFKCFICVTLPPGNKFQVKRLHSSAFHHLLSWLQQSLGAEWKRSGVSEAQEGGMQSAQRNEHVLSLKWQTQASRVSLGYVGKSFNNHGRKSLMLFSFSFARCLEYTTNVYSPTSERCSLPGKVCVWPMRTATKRSGRACPP